MTSTLLSDTPGSYAVDGMVVLPSQRSEEGYLENAPKGSQVVIDPGRLWLGCTTWPKGDGCAPSVLAKDTVGRFIYLNGFGTEEFMKPGAEMELFTDGSHAEAQLDVDETSPGNTLFWARLPHAVVWVRAYDGERKLLAEHRLRDCRDPADCEVR